ncbi:MAG: SDR family oxidoreductase [Caulobacteraceae bacterium]|nr:MAG: SDR family oxidoreductase [Caulobacteraceae bacterium]
MDLGLKGKRALVTGGTRGIGRAIADLLAAEGCDVALCARNPDQVSEAVAALQATGVKAWGETLDVSAEGALAGLVDRAAEALGGLDIFVSNVSGAMGLGNEPAAWKQAVEVDILRTIEGCEAAAGRLGDGGSIIVIGTVSAVEISGPRRPYASVKAALIPYVKNLARDLGPRNIRANVVAPGPIYFKGGVWDMVEQHMPDRFEAVLKASPLGRLGGPEEIANAAVFLASPRAIYISGANLICDGAVTQRVDF